MKWKKAWESIIARAGRRRRGAPSRTTRRGRGGILSLGLMGALIAKGECAAQTPPAVVTPGPYRLTVRPRQMATATQTVKAGEFLLDSLKEYRVYVPPPCVGARRCPLFVVLHGGNVTAADIIDRQRSLADKYEMILLAPNAVDTSELHVWDGFLSFFTHGWYAIDSMGSSPTPDVANIDAALKQVLRKFAIDPDKIAVAGFSAGGAYSPMLGLANLDIFSRIISMSASFRLLPSAASHLLNYRPGNPRHYATQFFLSTGTGEGPDVELLLLAQELRRDGYAVEAVLNLRGHADYLEDEDFMWGWLKESWEASSPTPRAAQRVAADSIPLLTDETLTRMTTFWTRFPQEPDSIREIARKVHQKSIMVPVGQQQMTVRMVDMAALAAKYPSVAAALKDAGLTPEQQEAYRSALVSVRTTKIARDGIGEVLQHLQPQDGVAGFLTIPATSVLAKNLEFLDAHPDALAALDATRIWDLQ